MDRFRLRFSLSRLLAHHIEESYTIRRLRDSSLDLFLEARDEVPEMTRYDQISHTNQPNPVSLTAQSIPLDAVDLSRYLPVQQNLYDPGERIPSYELSQEQHQNQIRNRNARGTGSSTGDSGPAIVTTTNLRGRFFESRPSRNLGRDRDRSTSSPARSGRKSLKSLGLKFLNARQHILLALCRDISLIPCFHGLFQAWWVFLRSGPNLNVYLVKTSARMSEHFLTGIWCIVSGYLLYQVLDGLMVRWIVTYSTTGAIVRMLSMSTILITIEEYLIAAFSAEGYTYTLHTWILISCALTLLYVVQNFVTSNIDLKGKQRRRFFDLYAIAVFAVVPVGLASFITMIGVLRSLLILRMDLVDQMAVRVVG